jgi:hypothetical protein
MPSDVLNNGNLNILTNSLPDLLKEVEAGFHKGFMLDTESNSGYPQMLGVLFTVTMFPSEKAPEVKVLPNDSVPSVEDVPKVDGRKRKI